MNYSGLRSLRPDHSAGSAGKKAIGLQRGKLVAAFDLESVFSFKVHLSNVTLKFFFVLVVVVVVVVATCQDEVRKLVSKAPKVQWWRMAN